MFDDPRKNLRRIEAELQAAEAEEAAAQLLEEFEEEESGFLRSEDDTFHRSLGAGEVLDENAAVFVEKRKRKKKDRKKKKKNGCLPLVLLLELGAIGLVLWGWYLCLK